MNNQNIKQKKVLVIDDEDRILLSIKKQLKDVNYMIEFTNDPNDGLSLISNNSYHLVLCDIRMKPIDGIEVLENVRKKYPELSFVILTGYIDDKIIEKAKEIGVTDILLKPIRKKILIATIDKYI